jgi:hypothetical protein
MRRTRETLCGSAVALIIARLKRIATMNESFSIFFSSSWANLCPFKEFPFFLGEKKRKYSREKESSPGTFVLAPFGNSFSSHPPEG